MGTMIRSDGFRLSISGGIFLAMVSGLVFIVRLDGKADRGLEKFDAVVLQVNALREEMKADRVVINGHSVELREHRVMIRELQRRSGKQNVEGWPEQP
jgi:hypothetical protein